MLSLGGGLPLFVAEEEREVSKRPRNTVACIKLKSLMAQMTCLAESSCLFPV